MGGRPASTLSTPAPRTAILLLSLGLTSFRGQRLPRLRTSSTRRSPITRRPGTRREANSTILSTRTISTTDRRLRLLGALASPVARLATVKANVRGRRGAGPMGLLLEQGERVSLGERVRSDRLTDGGGRGDVSKGTRRGSRVLGTSTSRRPLGLILLLAISVRSSGANVAKATSKGPFPPQWWKNSYSYLKGRIFARYLQ
jgi:hypothetical protein